MRQRQKCDLCNEPLNQARGVHTFQTDQAELDVHPECAMQLFVGTWDEMEARHARGELIAETLAPPREEVSSTVQKADQGAADTSYLDELLASAARKAAPLTSKTEIAAHKSSYPSSVLAWSMNDAGEWEQKPIPTFVQKARQPQELIWKHQTIESEE